MRLFRTPLAWANLSHDTVRFVLFVAGIVFAVLLMFIQFGFRQALLDAQSLILSHLNADLVMVSPSRQAVPMVEPFPRRRLVQASAVPGVQSTAALYVNNGQGSVRSTNEKTRDREPARPARLIGLDPDGHLLKMPELDPADPAYLGDRLKMPGTALYDELTRTGPGGESVFGKLEPGMTTEIAGQRVRLVGSFRLGVDFTTDGCMIVSEQTFADLLKRPYFVSAPLAEVDFGLIRLEPGADREQVRQAIIAVVERGQEETIINGKVVKDSDVLVATPEELIERENAFWLENTPIGYAFNLGALMGVVVGIVICYQILSGDVADHLPEYATLKAMGYRNFYLAWIVVQEALILAALGYVIGFVLSWLLYAVLADFTNLPIGMNGERAVHVLILTVGMCVVSALIALVRLMGADPADVF